MQQLSSQYQITELCVACADMSRAWHRGQALLKAPIHILQDQQRATHCQTQYYFSSENSSWSLSCSSIPDQSKSIDTKTVMVGFK